MTTERAFQKHPAAVALDEWLASDEGTRCLSPGAHGVYLENRLKLAFLSGWAACDRAYRTERQSV
jgi:hypothetical protein